MTEAVECRLDAERGVRITRDATTGKYNGVRATRSLRAGDVAETLQAVVMPREDNPHLTAQSSGMAQLVHRWRDADTLAMLFGYAAFYRRATGAADADANVRAVADYGTSTVKIVATRDIADGSELVILLTPETPL